MRIPGNIIHFRIHTFLLQIEKIIAHEYLLVILLQLLVIVVNNQLFRLFLQVSQRSHDLVIELHVARIST